MSQCRNIVPLLRNLPKKHLDKLIAELESYKFEEGSDTEESRGSQVQAHGGVQANSGGSSQANGGDGSQAYGGVPVPNAIDFSAVFKSEDYNREDDTSFISSPIITKVNP